RTGTGPPSGGGRRLERRLSTGRIAWPRFFAGDRSAPVGRLESVHPRGGGGGRAPRRGGVSGPRGLGPDGTPCGDGDERVLWAVATTSVDVNGRRSLKRPPTLEVA